MNIIVTGGAGFIGSALVRHLIQNTDHNVLNIDKLTYAGHLESLEPIANDQRYRFEQADICDAPKIQELFTQFQPDLVMHLAAESHVDRSIDGSAEFIRTNIVGTHTLLETARHYLKSLEMDVNADWNEPGEPATAHLEEAARAKEKHDRFRFLHVSTDEVYGELGDTGLFTEETPYDPRSPYSASKASSDHLARAWHHTYGLPVLVTNCSNNYGPYQFPEKLIPVVILKALQNQPIPVYGKGENVRDWLYVDDHARALFQVALEGTPGETYNIGGHNEKKNLDVVHTLCHALDELKPKNEGSYADQIQFVTDRPGHDFRYAIDASKIADSLGWTPDESFDTGMRKTVEWYLNNIEWCEAVTENNYDLGRLGTAG